MSDTPQWNGRDVEFVEFDIEAGEQLMEVAKGPDKAAAMYLTLVLAMRYADDGKPVFNSVAEVRAQPFRLIERIQRLAALATEANKVEADANAPLDVARADIPASARAGIGANGARAASHDDVA